MSYIFKFENNDVFVNTVKAYPEVQFSIYQGIAYYNLEPPTSGSAMRTAGLTNPSDKTGGGQPLYSPTGSLAGATDPPIHAGYLSLYEENVGRVGGTGLTTTTVPDLTTFENAVRNSTDPQDEYTGLNPRIEPFVVKNGDRLGFSTVGLATFNSTAVGAIMGQLLPSHRFYL